MKKVFVFLMTFLALTNCDKSSVNVVVEPSIPHLKAGVMQTGIVYSYHGNNFNNFSCGVTYMCENPNPLYTSYSTSDYISAEITLNDPLPGNLNLQDIRNLAGFSLTMTDGHQIMTLDPGVPGEAIVSTDADGNIIAPWSVFVNCCPYPNNNIFALNYPNVRGVGDGGYLTCPTGGYLQTPRNGGMIFGSPGVWTTQTRTPEEQIGDLVTSIQNIINIELNTGQANGLTKPLTNALKSIQNGKIAAACSQLSQFIDEVNAKTPKLSEATAASLIDEANAIKIAIGC